MTKNKGMNMEVLGDRKHQIASLCFIFVSWLASVILTFLPSEMWDDSVEKWTWNAVIALVVAAGIYAVSSGFFSKNVPLIIAGVISFFAWWIIPFTLFFIGFLMYGI